MTLTRLCVLALVFLQLNACSDNSSSNQQSNDGVVEVIKVGSSLVPCTGVAEMQCMWVQRAGETQWQYFYDTIHGFDFQPGYIWTLEVNRTDVENPPADASSLRWDLIRIVQQQSDPAALDSSAIQDLEVAARRVTCESPAGETTRCLQLRELGAEHWTNWPADIEGYQHTGGVASTLKVRRAVWQNTAQKPLSTPYRIVLVSVISLQSS